MKTFVCSECARRSSEPGECPCGGGPLLDIADPNVVDALRDEEQRRTDRAKQRNHWIGVAAGLLGVGAVLFVVPGFFLAIPLPIPFGNPIKVVGLMILAAAGTSLVLDRVAVPSKRFPELSYGAAHAGDIARMRQTSRGTVIAIAAIAGVLVLAGIGATIAKAMGGDDDRPLRRFSNADSEGLPSATRERPKFKADDFPVLLAGVHALQGRVDLGEGRFGLLLVGHDNAVATCEVKPDDETPVRCSPLAREMRASSAHLVEGAGSIQVTGVTKMGATPEETEYSTFDASGEKVGDRIDDAKLATDRPQIPILGDVWVDRRFEGTHVLLRRKSGGLALAVDDSPEELLVRSHDADGPALGMPMVFDGTKATVLLFHGEDGISALRITGEGAEPVGR